MDLIGIKIRCQQSGITSVGSWGESIPLPFPLSRSHLCPLAHDHFFLLQSQQHSIFSPLCPLLPSLLLLSLTLTLLPPSISYKNPCDYIGPIWIIQDELPIAGSLTYVKSPFWHLRNVFTSYRDQVMAVFGEGSLFCLPHLFFVAALQSSFSFCPVLLLSLPHRCPS